MALSNQYLQTLTTNATRLGTRIQESISEQARELTTARGNSASYLDNAGNIEDRTKVSASIKKQLESNSEREKLDALKRLVALTSKSHPPSSLTLTFFPSVVKLVASPSLEVRKLVYIYLLHHSPYDPDLALLSINTFQRDLSSDPNPVIRAMALRVLSGIRVPMVGNVVVMGIKKCASDTSPYVRKVAALAIPKCYELDPSHLSALLPILTQTLLSPSAFSPLCIGATVYAFNVICPGASVSNLSLIHPHFRKLCRVLLDTDEWGQIELMRLLLRYARVMLPRPVHHGGNETMEKEELDKDLKLLLDSVEPTFHSRNPAVVMAATRIYYYLAPPSRFVKFLNPLLRLVEGASPGVERVVLRYIVLLTSDPRENIAHLFASYYSRFYIRLSSDPLAIKQDKIRVLINLITPSHSAPSDYIHDLWPAVLRELIDYTDDTDDLIVGDSVKAIGVLAKQVGPLTNEATKMCFSALMNMIKSPHDIVVSSAVQVLKELVHVQLQLQQTSNSGFDTLKDSSSSPLSIVSHLARKFDDIKHAEARACIAWLVGQYARSDTGAQSSYSGGIDGIADWAPDLLRKGAKSFASEESIVKLQLVTLTAKLIVLAKPPAGITPTPSSPSPPGADHSTETAQPSPPSFVEQEQIQQQRKLALLAKYVLTGLARYDLNYDVRDRARVVWGLVRGLVEQRLKEGEWEDKAQDEPRLEGVVLRREQVRVVLFEGKAVTSDSEIGLGGLRGKAIGSLAVFAPGGSHVGHSRDRDLDDEEEYQYSVDEDVPDWSEKGVESKLRDSEEDQRSIQKAPLTGLGSTNFSSGSGMGSHMKGQGQFGKVVLVPTNFSGSNPQSASSSVPGTPGGRFAEMRGDADEGKKKCQDLDAFYAEESEEGEEDGPAGEEEEDSDDEEDDDEEEEEEEEEEGEEGEEDSEEENDDDDGHERAELLRAGPP